jgi:hypothetical protein
VRAPALLGAASLVLATAVAVTAVVGLSDGWHAQPKEPVLTYEAQVLPIVKDWGSVEVLGMRPAVADLRSGGALGAPDVVAAQARAWRGALLADRTKLREARPPRVLRQMAALLDDSMSRYLLAVDFFESATKLMGRSRLVRIDEGIARAKEGARLFDDAARVLAKVRRDLGLPPSIGFRVPGGDA